MPWRRGKPAQPGPDTNRSPTLKRFKPFIVSEIIATLVLASVLGVFLHERFAREEAQSRSIALAGLAGSVRSGAALAHSIWVSDGADAAAVALNDGQTVEIDLLTGYPRANRNGIHSVAPGLDGFDVKVDVEAETFVFYVVGVPVHECNVTYRTGSENGQPPTVTVKNGANGGDCS